GKDEIDRMVKEAEAHAAEDKARRESVEVRNEAEALCFRTEKLLEENKEAIPADVADPVKESIDKVRETLKGEDNTDEIKSAMEELNKTAQAMGQAMYANAQAQSQAESSADSESSTSSSDNSDGDDVVDAEIIDEDK
ncbi:MAG: Hsp70 family protein, partial [Propionibacteriaceae bacterium]|nr:Hsp70 family protein [Propionibacteriaceae bacterium]